MLPLKSYQPAWPALPPESTLSSEPRLLMRTMSGFSILPQPRCSLMFIATQMPRILTTFCGHVCVKGPCCHVGHVDLSGLNFHIGPWHCSGPACCIGQCLSLWPKSSQSLDWYSQLLLPPTTVEDAWGQGSYLRSCCAQEHWGSQGHGDLGGKCWQWGHGDTWSEAGATVHVCVDGTATAIVCNDVHGPRSHMGS